MLADIAADRCYDQAVATRPSMSEEQLKAFLEKLKADTSLQEKLKAAADSDAVLAIAKEAGFSISDDDLKKAQSEISDEELESVFKVWSRPEVTQIINESGEIDNPIPLGLRLLKEVPEFRSLATKAASAVIWS